METLFYSRMKSPIGPLWVAVSKKGLVAIEFGGREFPPIHSDPNASWVISEERTEPVRKQLTEYFDGSRTEFTLAIDLRSGTEFQRACWEMLLKIPYGQTRSYLEVAKAVGRPQASRAVGQANHHNPIPIVIPCHRVINTDGGLGGYGGGLDMKEQLLAHERALPGSAPLFPKVATKSAKSGK